MIYLPEYWDDVDLIIKSIPNIEKLQNKKILITGSTGMVCSAVVDVLSYLNHTQNTNIHLMLAGRSKDKIKNRFKEILCDNEYEYINYDATIFKKFEIIADLIIHGASNANPAIYSKQPVETLLGNIIGLNSMLELARYNKGSRLLFISSSEVYGNRVDDRNKAFKEEEYGYVDNLNPRACYPNGKRSAETLCACYEQEYDVDSVIVRLGHIYGPTITHADTRASASFTRDVSEGKNIVMKSSGAQLRSYCYVLDCVSAILTVLLNGERGNAYNISNKNSIASIREMAEVLAKEGNVEVVYENPTDAEKKSYNLMDNSALDAHKLELLGWKAVFDLNEGVKRTLLFYI